MASATAVGRRLRQRALRSPSGGGSGQLMSSPSVSPPPPSETQHVREDTYESLMQARHDCNRLERSLQLEIREHELDIASNAQLRAALDASNENIRQLRSDLARAQATTTACDECSVPASPRRPATPYAAVASEAAPDWGESLNRSLDEVQRLQEALAESADEKRQLRGEIVEIQQQFMEERTAFEAKESQLCAQLRVAERSGVAAAEVCNEQVHVLLQKDEDLARSRSVVQQLQAQVLHLVDRLDEAEARLSRAEPGGGSGTSSPSVVSVTSLTHSTPTTASLGTDSVAHEAHTASTLCSPCTDNTTHAAHLNTTRTPSSPCTHTVTREPHAALVPPSPGTDDAAQPYTARTPSSPFTQTREPHAALVPPSPGTDDAAQAHTRALTLAAGMARRVRRFRSSSSSSSSSVPRESVTHPVVAVATLPSALHTVPLDTRDDVLLCAVVEPAHSTGDDVSQSAMAESTEETTLTPPALPFLHSVDTLATQQSDQNRSGDWPHAHDDVTITVQAGGSLACCHEASVKVGGAYQQGAPLVPLASVLQQHEAAFEVAGEVQQCEAALQSELGGSVQHCDVMVQADGRVAQRDMMVQAGGESLPGHRTTSIQVGVIPKCCAAAVQTSGAAGSVKHEQCHATTQTEAGLVTHAHVATQVAVLPSRGEVAVQTSGDQDSMVAALVGVERLPHSHDAASQTGVLQYNAYTQMVVPAQAAAIQARVVTRRAVGTQTQLDNAVTAAACSTTQPVSRLNASLETTMAPLFARALSWGSLPVPAADGVERVDHWKNATSVSWLTATAALSDVQAWATATFGMLQQLPLPAGTAAGHDNHVSDLAALSRTTQPTPVALWEARRRLGRLGFSCTPSASWIAWCASCAAVTALVCEDHVLSPLRVTLVAMLPIG